MKQPTVVQQHSRLGIEVLQGCSLMQLTDQQIHEFKSCLWEHGVVVVRQQHLTALELQKFASQTFGDSTLGLNPKPSTQKLNQTYKVQE